MAASLPERVSNLRALLEAHPTLKLSTGVFPLLLDHFGLQCTDAVFPVARVMYDEDDAASPTGCKTRLVQAHRVWQLPTSIAPQCAVATRQAPGPLTALADVLTGKPAVAAVAVHAAAPAVQPPTVRSPEQALRHLYATGSPNLAEVDSISVVDGYCVVVSKLAEFTLKDVLKFNRHLLRWGDEAAHEAGPRLVSADPVCEDDLPCRLLALQCMDALLAVHRGNLAHNGICPDAFGVTDALLVKLRPPSAPVRERERVNLTRAWRDEDLSNLDYLLAMNAHAGRSAGGASEFHAILPWVILGDERDYPTPEFRDLSKSKFRLKKGDRQLDQTYSQPHAGAAHHIPESLSDLAYYVYMARLTPTRGLQHVVRRNFEPKEYPSSLARLYEWTPEECPPELYVDAAAFKATDKLAAMSDDPVRTIAWQLRQLETRSVREHLHEWIDLNFGHGLQGRAAVDAMNVPLPGVRGGYALVRSPVFVRVFEKPHPPQWQPDVTHSPPQRRSESALVSLFKAILAPRDGLFVRQDRTKASFAGSDLVLWLQNHGFADSPEEAVALAHQLMRAGFFMPERGGEDDFADTDDVYTFRERGDPPRHKPDVVPRGVTNTAALLDDVDHDGLYSTAYYSPNGDVEEDAMRADERALGRVIAELYLGVPLVHDDDVLVLQSCVRDVVLKLTSPLAERQLAACRAALCTPALQAASGFLAQVWSAAPASSTQAFLSKFPQLGPQAARLVLPTALRLMLGDGMALVYSQLRASAPDDAVGVAEAALAKVPARLVELPALDFLPRLVDAAQLGSDAAVDRLKALGTRLLATRVFPLLRARQAPRALLQRLGGDADDADVGAGDDEDVWARLPCTSGLSARHYHRLVTHVADGPAQCAAGDARLLAVANKKGDVALFDIAGPRLVERARVKAEGAIETMRFVGEHSDTLAMRAPGHRGLVFDVATWQRVSPWIPKARCVEAGPNAAVFVGGTDGDVVLVDQRAPGTAHTWTLGAGEEPVRALAWCAESRCFVAAAANGDLVNVVDVRGRVVCAWRPPARVHRVFLQGGRVVMVRGDWGVRVVDMPTTASPPREVLRVRGVDAVAPDESEDIGESACLLFNAVHAARGDDAVLSCGVGGQGDSRLTVTRMANAGGGQRSAFSFACAAGNMLVLGGAEPVARPAVAQQAWVRAMCL